MFKLGKKKYNILNTRTYIFAKYAYILYPLINVLYVIDGVCKIIKLP